jgi:hypothetical protein
MARLPQPDPNANDLAACRRKRGYTLREATRRIYDLKASRGLAVTKYKCPHCPAWHLTKMGARP